MTHLGYMLAQLHAAKRPVYGGKNKLAIPSLTIRTGHMYSAPSSSAQAKQSNTCRLYD